MSKNKTKTDEAEGREKLIPFSVWIEEGTENVLNKVTIETGIRPAVLARMFIKDMLRPENEKLRNYAIRRGLQEETIRFNSRRRAA